MSYVPECRCRTTTKRISLPWTVGAYRDIVLSDSPHVPRKLPNSKLNGIARSVVEVLTPSTMLPRHVSLQFVTIRVNANRDISVLYYNSGGRSALRPPLQCAVPDVRRVAPSLPPRFAPLRVNRSRGEDLTSVPVCPLTPLVHSRNHSCSRDGSLGRCVRRVVHGALSCLLHRRRSVS
jgi:hypothetical protein